MCAHFWHLYLFALPTGKARLRCRSWKSGSRDLQAGNRPLDPASKLPADPRFHAFIAFIYHRKSHKVCWSVCSLDRTAITHRDKFSCHLNVLVGFVCCAYPEFWLCSNALTVVAVVSRDAKSARLESVFRLCISFLVGFGLKSQLSRLYTAVFSSEAHRIPAEVASTIFCVQNLTWFCFCKRTFLKKTETLRQSACWPR